MEAERIGGYECGFNSFCGARLGFSFRFFLISILFLIFDVEITLILVIPYISGRIMGLGVFGVFLFVLVGGLLYEYDYGALEWVR